MVSTCFFKGYLCSCLGAMFYTLIQREDIKRPYFVFVCLCAVSAVSVASRLTLTDTAILLPQWGQLTEAAPTIGAVNSSVIGTFKAVAIFSNNVSEVFPLFTRVSVNSVTPKIFASSFCVIPFCLQISFSLIFIYVKCLFVYSAKISTKTTLKEHTSEENNGKSIFLFCFYLVCIIFVRIFANENKHKTIISNPYRNGTNAIHKEAS